MFSLQATYNVNDNFDVTLARTIMEMTLIHASNTRGDNLIIIPSIQTPGVQQLTNPALKVYVRRKRVRKESIYLRSLYIDPLKKPQMLVAFEVKPSIEVNDRLASERQVTQANNVEP